MENNNLSDFIKVAYKYGKVRELNEAFEEFPVEEEWHKGKIEKLLEEDVVYKILNSQIIFKIGKVDLNKVEEYKNNFYDNIKL